MINDLELRLNIDTILGSSLIWSEPERQCSYRPLGEGGQNVGDVKRTAVLEGNVGDRRSFPSELRRHAKHCRMSYR